MAQTWSPFFHLTEDPCKLCWEKIILNISRRSIPYFTKVRFRRLTTKRDFFIDLRSIWPFKTISLRQSLQSSIILSIIKIILFLNSSLWRISWPWWKKKLNLRISWTRKSSTMYLITISGPLLLLIDKPTWDHTTAISLISETDTGKFSSRIGLQCLMKIWLRKVTHLKSTRFNMRSTLSLN